MKVLVIFSIMTLTACSSLPADSAGSAEPVAAPAPETASVAPTPSATTAATVQSAGSDVSVPTTTGAELTSTVSKPEPDDPKIEKIVTTGQRAMYCDNAPPTGSRITRGNRCYIPKSKLERQQAEILQDQIKEEFRDSFEKEQRDRLDCEAMRGHANGAPVDVPSCFR